MKWTQQESRGITAALGAAVLFGCGTPIAKALLVSSDPWLLAGLLYLGSGIGLALYRQLRQRPVGRVARKDVAWLVGAIIAGGVVGPVLLMLGLAGMPASGASLLLTTEGAFTALLAWFMFHENFDRRVMAGMGLILSGGVALSWPIESGISNVWPVLSVLGACLAWGVDNNLTRHVSLADATWIASIKGLAAGLVNLALALMLGASWPPLPTLAGALVLGAVSYGASLTLFVIGLRHLGAARTGAYFSVAPFLGAILAVALLDERATVQLLLAAVLMGCGVWLHLTEVHSHEHFHESMGHAHEHEHDEHHQHEHDTPVPPATRHFHWHKHPPMTHAHRHFPDVHHRHRH